MFNFSCKGDGKLEIYVNDNFTSFTLVECNRIFELVLENPD